MSKATHGMTLIEILAASLIGAVVAGGTLAAFVTAIRLARQPTQTSTTAFFGGQTLERFRNRIACDDVWFDANADCTPDADLPTTWTNDPDPAPVTARQYMVTALDCDGVDGPGDCFQVRVRVTD